ncbi:hypothetical protein ANO11243_027870 [Dothideomycetidae sp. 11243]|nr:hypothetical protein ANO11243_027870 [fungal sp. No.11243]
MDMRPSHLGLRLQMRRVCESEREGEGERAVHSSSGGERGGRRRAGGGGTRTLGPRPCRKRKRSGHTAYSARGWCIAPQKATHGGPPAYADDGKLFVKVCMRCDHARLQAAARSN